MCRLRFYICSFILCLGFFNSFAQQLALYQKYSFKFSHQTVEAVLDSISNVTGYGFSYNPSILSSDKRINATYNNQPLLSILQDIFKEDNLNFKQVCSYITITRKQTENEESSLFSSYIDSSEYYYLRAKVLDAGNKKPISFANVLLKGRNVGTISNIDGNFNLKVPSGCINDSVSISFIGYRTITLNITAIAANDIIMLTPVPVQLKEVVVKHYEPTSLIKTALGKVGSNYSESPELQIGFYRETSRQNNDYVVISEAVLKILKAAYDKNYRTDQVIVYKNRKNPFVKTMDTVLYKLQGGIYNSLMIDLAKYPASFMSEEYFDMYRYTFDGLVQYNEGMVYVISFDQRPEVQYPLYKGKIYIDQETLAIVKAEFGISPIGLDYATEALVKKSSSKIKAKVLGANYLVSYSNTGDRWKLHHVREEIRIRVRKKYSFFNSVFHSVSELVITDSDTATNVQFKGPNLVRSGHILAEVSNSYDESFWGKFNFIEPEISLEEAYSKIKDALEEKK
jgi:hypothetical protein